MARFTRLALRTGAVLGVCLAFSRLGYGYALEGGHWPNGTIPMALEVGNSTFVLPDGFLSWY
ncbi:MAG: hypothetical protein DMF04_07340, partial [Verrucomicrobia bacterium]